jgi:hypothetical protein
MDAKDRDRAGIQQNIVFLDRQINSPGLAAALHLVGQLDILTVNVKLPLTLT